MAAGYKKDRYDDDAHVVRQNEYAQKHTARKLKAEQNCVMYREIGHEAPEHKVDHEPMLVSVRKNGHALKNTAPENKADRGSCVKTVVKNSKLYNKKGGLCKKGFEGKRGGK